jgi:hypothetical protein
VKKAVGSIVAHNLVHNAKWKNEASSDGWLHREDHPTLHLQLPRLFSGSAILLSFLFLGAIISFAVAATDATLVLQQWHKVVDVMNTDTRSISLVLYGERAVLLPSHFPWPTTTQFTLTMPSYFWNSWPKTVQLVCQVVTKASAKRGILFW